MFSGTSFPSLTLNCTTAPQKRQPIDVSAQSAISAEQTDLLAQIARAFQKPPNLARVLHGDRKIRQGERGRRTALFPSSKCGGNIPLESQLELAYAVVLESEQDVQDYRTQAIRITLPEGKFSHPDFLVRKIDGALEVHEVKPSIEDLSEADIRRFQLIRSVLAEVNVGFRLVDTRNLPSPSVLQDLLQLYSRGHLQAFSKVQIDLARSLLTRRGKCTCSDAAQLLVQYDLPAQLIDFLRFHGYWGSVLDISQKTGWGDGR